MLLKQHSGLESDRHLYPVLRHRSARYPDEKCKCNVGSQTLREMQLFFGDERRSILGMFEVSRVTRGY
ncbi:hypothetical protein [Microseira sp. BLCC-F43]|jgi:hypothetical protein|uniref:hypothetical protein n=1 Tax=Microseira sp. BLCC-F43 TaxID=3153602 RepID=UPI0035B95380